MNAAVDSTVGNFYCSTAEGGELAWLKDLVWIFAANGEGDVVCPVIPTNCPLTIYVHGLHTCDVMSAVQNKLL